MSTMEIRKQDHQLTHNHSFMQNIDSESGNREIVCRKLQTICHVNVNYIQTVKLNVLWFLIQLDFDALRGIQRNCYGIQLKQSDESFYFIFFQSTANGNHETKRKFPTIMREVAWLLCFKSFWKRSIFSLL